MEEKVLIRSEHYSVKKFVIISCILAIIASTCMLSYNIYENFWSEYDASCYNEAVEDGFFSYSMLRDNENISRFNSYCSHLPRSEHYHSDSYRGKDAYKKFFEAHPSVWSYMRCLKRGDTLIYAEDFQIPMIPMSVVVIALIVNWWLKSYSLVVTNKRIYGYTAFGKRVDLPLDFVSSVGTHWWLKGIKIGSSSGRINFLLVKNQDAIHEVISNLLIERQNKKNSEKKVEQSPVSASSSADELKKFKDLLDSGIITQEEFDAKKKQLLGL